MYSDVLRYTVRNIRIALLAYYKSIREKTANIMEASVQLMEYVLKLSNLYA